MLAPPLQSWAVIETNPNQMLFICPKGPIAATITSKVTIVGVTSFGEGCAEKPYPGVYARVSTVLDWILDNTDADECQN